MGVSKGSESFILLLPCCIPETEINMLAVDLNSSSIVVKHCWDVVCWELILCVTDEDASLPDRTVANNDQLDGDRLLSHK